MDFFRPLEAKALSQYSSPRVMQSVMSFLIKPCRPVAQLGLTDKVKLINPGSASAEHGSSDGRTVEEYFEERDWFDVLCKIFTVLSMGSAALHPFKLCMIVVSLSPSCSSRPISLLNWWVYDGLNAVPKQLHCASHPTLPFDLAGGNGRVYL